MENYRIILLHLSLIHVICNADRKAALNLIKIVSLESDVYFSFLKISNWNLKDLYEFYTEFSGALNQLIIPRLLFSLVLTAMMDIIIWYHRTNENSFVIPAGTHL